MNVVFFQFVPHYGGAARSCIELAKRLQSHVRTVIVDPYGCAPEYLQAAQEAKIEFHVLQQQYHRTCIGGHRNILRRCWRIALAMPELLRLQQRAARFIETLEPAVICCDNFKSAFIIGTARRLRQVPVVPLLRGWYIPDMVPGYARWLCRHRCERIIAVSHATRSALMCSVVPAERIHVVHNPIDSQEAFCRAALPLAGPAPQWERPVRILLPAGILREKGQHTAVEALSMLLRRGWDAVLWMAGDHQSIEGNRGYMAEVQALAEQLGVAQRVEWLGIRSDILPLMRTATVVVLPSHREGHPRVILEAMALGKPVCACPAGGILDMILDGYTGLLFDFDNASGLAACVERLARDPVAAAAMGARAQEFIHHCFSPTEHTQRILEVFREAAADGRPDQRQRVNS